MVANPPPACRLVPRPCKGRIYRAGACFFQCKHNSRCACYAALVGGYTLGPAPVVFSASTTSMCLLSGFGRGIYARAGACCFSVQAQQSMCLLSGFGRGYTPRAGACCFSVQVQQSMCLLPGFGRGIDRAGACCFFSARASARIFFIRPLQGRGTAALAQWWGLATLRVCFQEHLPLADALLDH